MRSPSLPLLKPSLSHFAAQYAEYAVDCAEFPASRPSVARVLWSAAEAALVLPRIEAPGEKGGDGIYVEKSLLDSFLPFNATFSLVRASARARLRHGSPCHEGAASLARAHGRGWPSSPRRPTR